MLSPELLNRKPPFLFLVILLFLVMAIEPYDQTNGVQYLDEIGCFNLECLTDTSDFPMCATSPFVQDILDKTVVDIYQGPVYQCLPESSFSVASYTLASHINRAPPV